MPKEKESIIGSIKKIKSEEKVSKVEKEKSDKAQER